MITVRPSIGRFKAYWGARVAYNQRNRAARKFAFGDDVRHHGQACPLHVETRQTDRVLTLDLADHVAERYAVVFWRGRRVKDRASCAASLASEHRPRRKVSAEHQQSAEEHPLKRLLAEAAAQRAASRHAEKGGRKRGG
jgi:hypothetical protein